MSNNIIYKADERGHADHGWLNAHHSFSFAGYHDPAKVHFGVLRVLNDDIVAGGKGFGAHPHDNMEIITIPLEGALAHSDNMGNQNAIIRHGDIQVMSAGTGVYHSEFNADPKEPVKLLQIWLFPNKRNVTPRYDQISLNLADRENKFQQILSPNPDDEGVWIHQNAWFHLAKFEQGLKTDYTRKAPGNGIYAFVISGNVTINGQVLGPRDAMGITDTDLISVTADTGAEVLLMDLPMEIKQ